MEPDNIFDFCKKFLNLLTSMVDLRKTTMEYLIVYNLLKSKTNANIILHPAARNICMYTPN